MKVEEIINELKKLERLDADLFTDDFGDFVSWWDIEEIIEKFEKDS